MKKQTERRLALLEIILSVGVIAGSVLLLVSWEKYEWAFTVVFGFAAALLFVRALSAYLLKKGKGLLHTVLCLSGAAVMCALATAVTLAMLE